MRKKHVKSTQMLQNDDDSPTSANYPFAKKRNPPVGSHPFAKNTLTIHFLPIYFHQNPNTTTFSGNKLKTGKAEGKERDVIEKKGREKEKKKPRSTDRICRRSQKRRSLILPLVTVSNSCCLSFWDVKLK